MKEAKLNIIYYITGYVVSKITYCINCVTCIQSLLTCSNSIDYNYIASQYAIHTPITSLKMWEY